MLTIIGNIVLLLVLLLLLINIRVGSLNSAALLKDLAHQMAIDRLHMHILVHIHTLIDNLRVVYEPRHT